MSKPPKIPSSLAYLFAGLLIVASFVSIGLGHDDDTADRIQGLEQARAEAVRSRGFIRAAETQLTKTIAAIDAELEILKGQLPTDPGPDPIEPPDPTPTPEPGVNAIPVGDGWTTPPPAPQQIGTADEKAIAQWNAVPEQQIEERFAIGVVAHHVDGIRDVRIGAEAGEWITINEPSINPRTGSSEYWGEIQTGGETGWIEVRAIVTPRQGVQEVRTLALYAGANEDLFPVVELTAGTYDAQDLLRRVPQQNRGWTTIQPAAGVDRADVVITGNASSSGRHVRFKDVTRKLGRWDEHNSRRDGDSWWWFDGTRIEGNGLTRWIVNEGGRQFYTEATIDEVNRAFYSATVLARDVTIERVWEDVCNAYGMLVDVTIERIDRGEFTAKHPDLFQWANANGVSGFIAQDVTSLNNGGQGLFTGPIKDSAFVRVIVQIPNTPGEFYYALQMLNTTSNVLIKDSQLSPGILRPDKNFTADRLVLDSTPAPQNANLDGVEVRD